MKTQLSLIVFAAAAAFFIDGNAVAQTFHSHPIRIPGGSNVQVPGINDSGVMVANYTDSTGMAHCAMISGSTITQIVDPHTVGTGSGHGTSCWGINNAGEIVGSYSLSIWGNGFILSGGVYTDIVVPGATAGTTAYGINNVGQIVGSFADNVGQHGFLYTRSNGTFATLDVPGATVTLAIGINDGGTTTFIWLNSTSIFSGAILKNGHYRTLNVPGATQSEAFGINVHGWIDFSAQDASGVWHGYLYKGGTFTQYDVPVSTNTFGFGINSSGQLVGGYNPTGNPTAGVGFEGRIQ